MLRVVHSNRYESLARSLGHLIGADKVSPLQTPTVVVPNEGLGRWLWMQLADELGICANLKLQLPGSFIWELFHRLVPGVAEVSPYDRDTMAWRLHGLLRAAHGDPELAGLGQWRDCDDDRLRFDLARRLARQFDQYIVYRPDWIEAWGRGEQPHWQAALWRRLADQTGAPDWMSLHEQLTALDAAQVRERIVLPVYLFGVPLLSPGYVEVLRWLSEHVDVHLLLPNPCQEHWGDIVAERDFGRIAGVRDEKTLYVETGNGLLASWGAQARDLIDLINEADADTTERFVDPGDDTVLHAIQQQVLTLAEPGEPVDADARDRSIQVHSCHGAMRETEVLHDQLLGLLDSHPGLGPSDILVMTPDIERFAPCIEAVFGGSSEPIEYRIADRDPRAGLAVVDAFLALLGLAGRRFDANDVLAVLESPPVQRRFGLAEADLGNLREWVRSTGVRWGLDADSRDALSGAAALLHTWRDGLNRMLLGLAMPQAGGDGVFEGMLPYGEVEGSDALALGALAEYIGRLGTLNTGLRVQRTPQGWAGWLNEQFDLFFDVPEADESEAQQLRNVFATLGDCAMRAQYEQPVGFEVVLDWIDTQLDSGGGGRGFLGHGITFCRLTAMRNVPMRVIALLGMDYGSFPRQRERVGFDLIARHPRRGDRSRRDDDRYAFLECLLNAREVLYISYTGRDVRDDEPRPPSVVVSELLDYCQRNFRFGDGQGASDAIVTLHPLHPFSRRYFDASDARLFSYSRSRQAASAAHGDATQVPFAPTPLDEAPPELLDISLERLIEFFAHPCKFWFRRRLNVSFDMRESLIDTSDPLHLSALEKWQLQDEIVRFANEGCTDAAMAARMRLSPLVPAGPLGEILIARELERCRAFVDGYRAARPSEQPEIIDGTVALGAVSLHARMKVQPSGFFDWRHGKTNTKHYIGAWLRHLALQLIAPAHVDPRTTWYASDCAFVLAPVADARAVLDELARLYVAGLSEPLPFFPRSALAYQRQREKGNSHEQALDEAHKTFMPERAGPYYREAEDPYISRLFGRDPPLERCAELAGQILGPIFRHMQVQP